MSEFNSFEGCKPTMSFMPAYEDINEAVFYMAASADREYAKLESAFNMAEVLGESYLVEETGIKGFFQNIINWVKEQFEKIAGLFKKAIENIQKKSLEFSNKVKNKIKDKTKVVDKLKNLKGGDKVYGKTYEYKNWAMVESQSGSIWQSMDAVEARVKAVISAATSLKGDARFSGEDDKDSDKVDDYAKEVAATIIGGNGGFKSAISTENLSIDTGKMSSAIEDLVQGKEVEISKEYIIKNFDEMWKRTTDYRSDVVALQKNFKKIKKYYDDTLKALNAAARSDTGMFNKGKSMYTSLAKAVKLAKQFNNCAGGTAIKIINKRVAKEQLIVWRAVIATTVAGDKDKSMDKAQEKLKASQESAEVNIDDVTADLFNFS